MRFVSATTLVTILATLISLSNAAVDIPQNLKITNLLRTIDLTKPIVRETTSAAVRNVGTAPVTEYYFPLDDSYLSKLSLLVAENRQTKAQLEVTKAGHDTESRIQYYKVKLDEPLAADAKMQITIKSIFSNIILPFPTHVPLWGEQKFTYFGNAYALTAYPSAKQKTTVVTPNHKLTILEHPENSSPDVKNNQVVLGPFTDLAATQHAMFEVQYALDGPLPHIRDFRRDIEISHWGNNLAVEEHYSLVNNAAFLKGEFDRLKYQRQFRHEAQPNVIMGLQMTLPKLAKDIYYRDEIGNISTSIVTSEAQSTSLLLKPRFPIVGGWNTTFYIGYNEDLSQTLRNVKGTDRYILNVPVFKSIRDATYRNVEIRVVLPEGAKNVRVAVPFKVDKVEHSTTKTYMDSAGRYTVTIKSHNFVEEHGQQNLLVEYDYSTMGYFIKPIAAATMLMTVFATSMVVSRLNFQIGGGPIKK